MSQYYLAYDMYNQPYFGHHGIDGMKWGQRRWQNLDGSLTAAGRVHYGYGPPRESSNSSGKVMSYRDNKKLAKTLTKAINKQKRDSYSMKGAGDAERYKNQREVKKRMAEAIDSTDEQKALMKAYDELRKHEETTGMYKDKDGKWHKREWTDEEKKKYDELGEEVNKANKTALEKEKQVRDMFKDELLSAKLKDLGQEDTAEGRKVLNAILKDDDGVLSEFTGLKNSKEAKAALKELSAPKWEPLTAENSKSKYSESEKTAKLDRAENNDMWDLDFLESVQNSEMLHNNDTKAMLNEYTRYLDDPYKYMTEDSHKLKNM